MTSQALEVIEVVKATQRVPPEIPTGVTFFSRYDLWMYDATLDSKLCLDCLENESTPRYFGNELRPKFPHLRVLDTDTIGGPEPNGNGLVHPNCRCRLRRIKKWDADTLRWFIEYAG